MAFSNCIPKTKKCFSNVFIDKIRGGFASKLDELQVLLSDNNVDIAVITETWLNGDIDANILQIRGYMLFRLDRGDGCRGGIVAVGLYARHSLLVSDSADT